jgi:hypothetical protein
MCAPALQAGGHRFDPGWLHSQNPCKRAVFANRALVQTPVAGVRWKRFGSPLLGTGWLSRHGRRRTSQEACDEGGCGSRGRRALWGGLHGGGCVPTATLRRPCWLPPSPSARRWRAWSDHRYAHRSGGEARAGAQSHRRRSSQFAKNRSFAIIPAAAGDRGPFDQAQGDEPKRHLYGAQIGTGILSSGAPCPVLLDCPHALRRGVGWSQARHRAGTRGEGGNWPRPRLQSRARAIPDPSG